MSICAYSGSLGGGKTMKAIIDAATWSLAAGGAPIAANFWLNPASFARHFALNPRFRLVRIRDLDDLVRFMVEGGGILLWDEMHQDSDARQSTNLRNILLSQWLMFLRKWGITCLFTTQDPSQIDRRMRNVTDTLTFCEGWGARDDRTHRFTVTHYKSGRLLRQVTVPPEEIKPWHKAFDTFEPADRIPFPEKIKDYDAFLKRCGEGARFSREYDGDPDRAWQTFVSQSGDSTGKAAKSRKSVPQSDHVRKGTGRSPKRGGGPGTGDTGPLAEKTGA